MCQYSAVDGVIGPWHIQHLGSMAAGRPGLLIVESTGISPAGRISTGCTGIWNDEQVAKFREITALVHSQNVPIGIQLNHSGRKGSTMPSWWEYEVAKSSDGSWQTFAPSSIPLNGFPTPKELTGDEIAEIINDFAKAAKMSVQAGFDLIELHGAYGYLIHQFLSPISNKRSDNYGGNFEGRARFLKEIIQKIRSVVPDVMPLAKGLGSGVPIGAVVAGPKAAGIFQPGNHGTTFGGNPLAMRAGVETLRIMEEDGLLENAHRLGLHFKAAFEREFKGMTGVKDIRGQGLMIGIELDRPCGPLMGQALEAGLLLSITADSVIRLLPPLTMTETEADEVVAILVPLVKAFLNTPKA